MVVSTSSQPRPRPRQIWTNVRRFKGASQKVRILSVNEHRVAYEIIGGAGRSLKRRERLPIPAFVNCYQLEG